MDTSISRNFALLESLRADFSKKRKRIHRLHDHVRAQVEDRHWKLLAQDQNNVEYLATLLLTHDPETNISFDDQKLYTHKTEAIRQMGPFMSHGYFSHSKMALLTVCLADKKLHDDEAWERLPAQLLPFIEAYKSRQEPEINFDFQRSDLSADGISYLKCTNEFEVAERRYNHETILFSSDDLTKAIDVMRKHLKQVCPRHDYD